MGGIALEIDGSGGGVIESLGETIPAAGDFHGIIECEFVIRIADLGLEGLIDVFFIHSEDEHLVIREQVFPDCLTEAEAVELLAEIRDIVHRAEDGIGFVRLGLRLIAIKARGGGHVEAFFRLDEVVIVDFDEVGFVLAHEGNSGGTVGFIADDEIELGEAGLLRLGYGGDGVVGGKNDRQALRGGLFRCLADGVVLLGESACGSGGGEREIAELVIRGIVIALLLALADVHIRADGHGVDGILRVGGPLAQGLGEQRE